MARQSRHRWRKTSGFSRVRCPAVFTAGRIFTLAEQMIDMAKIRDTLALACAALRRFGLSRNRGWGEVSVALYDDFTNLTDGAVQALAQRFAGQSTTTAPGATDTADMGVGQPLDLGAE